MKLLNVPLVRFLGALTLASSAGSAQAFTCGPCTVTFQPTTQLGTLTDNLTCQFTGTDIIVTGDVTVAVSSAPPIRAGTLASWRVECPLATPVTNAITTTTLDGFVNPPPGTFNPTNGIVESSVEVASIPVAGSNSSIPVGIAGGTNPPGGTDSPLWTPALIATSGLFSTTTAAILKQRFDLDGVYTSGPGGNWVVDVPVRTSLREVAPVPIVSAWGLFALGTLVLGSGVVFLRRRSRGST